MKSFSFYGCTDLYCGRARTLSTVNCHGAHSQEDAWSSVCVNRRKQNNWDPETMCLSFSPPPPKLSVFSNKALKHFQSCPALCQPLFLDLHAKCLSSLPLNAPTLAPRVAHLHLKWMALDHRYQPLIAIAPLVSARTVVCCRECLHPMCFCNLSTTQSHSPRRRYYCQ